MSGRVLDELASRLGVDQDIDEVVVDRLMDGIPVRASRAEILCAVGILTLRGYGASEIGRRVCRSERVVMRMRSVWRPLGITT